MRDKTFHDICEKGTLEEVREALANGADVNEREKGVERGTTLMMAVFKRNEPLVSLLLQQPGIQVNAKNVAGWAALHYAALWSSRKVIRLLLDFPGIDTTIRDNVGETPLMKATKNHLQDFVQEHQKKIEDEKRIKYEKKIKAKKDSHKLTVDTSEGNQENRKRKRESSVASPQQTDMWKKLKTVQNRQKTAMEQMLKTKKENEGRLAAMEEKMVEELDKEFEDKMAALMMEKQEKRAEIAEKVKVGQEQLIQFDQISLTKLEKEHKTEREELMEDMWGQAEDYDDEEQKTEDTNQAIIMWKKLKSLKRQHRNALEQASKKKKETEEGLVKMEERMVEELDKEFKDKRAALVKEKQEKRAEIVEKVKVKQERQVQADQKAVEKLEKEHKAEREELMEEMWTKAAAADGDEEQDQNEEDVKEAAPNNHDQPNSASSPRSAPDCPICFEMMTPPIR